MIVGMDSIIPTALVSAVSVVNGAIASVRNARDIAKQSSDSALKDAVSEAYDAVLDLKDRVLDLDEENRQLKAKLAQKDSVKRDPKFGYYFKDGEPDAPLCQRCYEGAGRLAYLSGIIREDGGVLRRWCHQCEKSFYEEHSTRNQTTGSYDPLSWME
jgi:hypothetical protein